MSAAVPEEVRAAAARGWLLLPIRAREKTPLVKAWPQLATSDMCQLAAWRSNSPPVTGA